jgi:hypothetical protein
MPWPERQIPVRFLAVSVLVALATVVSAQIGSLTFSSPGEPVRQLLKKLSPLTGQTLTCTDSCADDVVVISVTNVAPKALLDRIAQAVDGQWEQKDAGFRLIRTSGQLAAEERAEKHWRINAVTAALAKKQKEIEVLPAFDEKTADRTAARLEKLIADFTPTGTSMSQILQLERQGPGARAVGRILSAMDPAELVSIPFGIKKLFATDPTRSEDNLPPAAVDAARQYVKDQTTWAEAAANYKIQAPSYQGVHYAGSAMIDELNKPTEAPARVLFAVTPENWKEFRFELVVADRQGEIVFESSDRLRLTADPLTPPAVAEPALTLPPIFAEFIKNRGGANSRKLTEEAGRTLLMPETIDPLAIGVGPLLIQSSQAHSENLVAMLGDDQMFAGIQSAGSMPTPTVLLTELRNALYDVKEADNWLQVSPKLFTKTRRERSERPILADYLRTENKNPFPGLDAQARFASRLPTPSESFLAPTLAGLLRGKMPLGVAPELLRFYGALDETQKQLAQTNQGLPFSQLSGSQWDLLEHLVYGPTSHVNFEGRQVRKVTNSMAHFGGVYRYPSECLPDGISDAGALHIKSSSSEAVFLADGADVVAMFPIGAGQLAQAQWDRDHGAIALTNDEQSLLSESTKFLVGTHGILEFSFTLGPGTTESLMAMDDRREDSPRPYRELPDEFLQRVAEEEAKIAKQTGG